MNAAEVGNGYPISHERDGDDIDADGGNNMGIIALKKTPRERTVCVKKSVLNFLHRILGHDVEADVLQRGCLAGCDLFLCRGDKVRCPSVTLVVFSAHANAGIGIVSAKHDELNSTCIRVRASACARKIRIPRSALAAKPKLPPPCSRLMQTRKKRENAGTHGCAKEKMRLCMRRTFT